MAESFYQTEIVGDAAEGSEQLKDFVPTVFIGLGGSGKDVLMRLRKKFDDTFGGPSTDFAHFLVIDTDAQEQIPKGENRRDFVRSLLDPTEFVDCTISAAAFKGVFEELRSGNRSMYSDWLKPSMENYGPSAVTHGAGTHRQFGRMALVLNFNDIRRRIKEHIDAVLEAAAGGLDDSKGVISDCVEIVIVTSLSGGTGSGMLIDIAYIVKDILSDAKYRSLANASTALFCVLPNAFEHKVGQLFKRFQQNGYAALLELEYYGTPRTGDELFLGESTDPDDSRTRVGFRAPWKSGRFIGGAGWEACYLIDSANPFAMRAPLALNEVYQMTADYLFLDFRRSDFSSAKRSVRPNLSQFRQLHKETKIWKHTEGRELERGQTLLDGENILYATHNGCTFSSFGLAEIAFDKSRVYRTAGYRLAAELVRQLWLGARVAAKVDKSELDDWAEEDLHNPKAKPGRAAPPSFLPSAIERELYKGRNDDWWLKLDEELDHTAEVTEADAYDELMKLVNTHRERLNRDGAEGIAQLTARERADSAEIIGTPNELGRYRASVKEAARDRCNQYGVATALRLLETYQGTLQKDDDNVAKDIGDGQDRAKSPVAILERLREADRVWWPAKSLAQQIEFPRAAEQIEEWVINAYHKCSGPYIQNIVRTVGTYIDRRDKSAPELAKHGTLKEYYQKVQSFLEQLADRLHERFEQTCREEGNNRRQSLFPTWAPEAYDVKIAEALLANDKISNAEGDHQPFPFDRRALEAEVASHLKLIDSEYTDVSSFSSLLEHWFHNQEANDEGVARVAEAIGTACRNLLEGSLKLGEAFADGHVIDLLFQQFSQDDRLRREKLLATSSAPYLPSSDEVEREANNFKPEFRSIFGRRAGDKGGVSDRNAKTMEGEVQKESQVLKGIRGTIDQVMDTDSTALVLCREVCGVPLQYYAYLNELHDAYHNQLQGSDRSVDECHINWHDSWEDLPDVRTISSDVYAQIRNNVDEVLFAIIVGTIYVDDGIFWVRVPDEFQGSDRLRLGTRINRIIKHACEKPEVRDYLKKQRVLWSQDANKNPAKWAAVYASALQTYEDSRTEILAQGRTYAPPIRNCFKLLLSMVTQDLQATNEGKQWAGLLRLPTDASEEQVLANNELFAKLKGEFKLLQRVSEAIPIYAINWSNLDQLQLPPP